MRIKKWKNPIMNRDTDDWIFYKIYHSQAIGEDEGFMLCSLYTLVLTNETKCDVHLFKNTLKSYNMLL